MWPLILLMPNLATGSTVPAAPKPPRVGASLRLVVLGLDREPIGLRRALPTGQVLEAVHLRLPAAEPKAELPGTQGRTSTLPVQGREPSGPAHRMYRSTLG